MSDAEFVMAENAGSYGAGAGDAAGDYGSAGAEYEGSSEDYSDFEEGRDSLSTDVYDSGEEGELGSERNFENTDFPSESRRSKREETRAFSQRLNARLDSEIAGLGFVDPYTGNPIRSKKDLDAFRARRAENAKKQTIGGVEPALFGEIARMKEQIAEYERQTTLSRQHERLTGDPKFGEVYNNNREAIRYLADHIEGLDLEAASMLFVRHNLDRIIEQAKRKAVSEALARNRAASYSSPGSLSGGGDPPENDIASMSPAEFARLVKKAEHGELKSI